MIGHMAYQPKLLDKTMSYQYCAVSMLGLPLHWLGTEAQSGSFR